MECWVKTDVTTEPVTVTEIKNFCKIPSTADDAIILMLGVTSREATEKYTMSSCAEKTLIAEFDKIPDDGILELPYGPVSSITSVVVVDEEGAEEALVLNTDYYVHGAIWKKLRVGQVLPNYTVRLKVEYVAGYGATSCPALPSSLKTTILKHCLTQYDRREDISVDNMTAELSNDSKSLAAPYRRMVWFG